MRGSCPGCVIGLLSQLGYANDANAPDEGENQGNHDASLMRGQERWPPNDLCALQAAMVLAA